MRLVKHKLIALSAGAITASLVSVAHAQNYMDQVWEQLKAMHGSYSGSNVRNYVVGKMGDDASDSWTFDFNSSVDYVIVGACDVDCSDLDISVIDMYGNVLVEDAASDDHPIVNFEPSGSGRYTVKVAMYSCSADPCYFGFGLLEN
jgi:hypothetical protein